MPPTSYELSAQLSGFATEIRKGVTVALGQTLIADFQLKVSATAVQVEVTDIPTVVETEEEVKPTACPSGISPTCRLTAVTLSFTSLMPGVSNSSTLAGNSDFRVKQTPQSGLSFYGSNGRGNSITVDGGETNDDAGACV